MRTLYLALSLSCLAFPALAQPLSHVPVSGGSMTEWGEGTAIHGGDCTATDEVVNGTITTVFDNPAGGLEFGQSFTAPCTGRVETISYGVFNTGTSFPSDSASVVMLLFEGAGTSGTLLASEPHTVRRPAVVNTGEIQAISFSADVAVTAGQTYTFFIDQLEGDIQLTVSNSNAYPDGIMYFTEDGNPANAVPSLPQWDLTFRVNLLPPAVMASEPTGAGSFSVSPVHPNPLRGRGRFSLDLGVSQPSRVAVHDVLGREVALLHDGYLPAGRHVFDVRADEWPSGVYFVEVRGEGAAVVRKVLVTR